MTYDIQVFHALLEIFVLGGHSNQLRVNVLLAIIVLLEREMRLANSVLLVTIALVAWKINWHAPL